MISFASQADRPSLPYSDRQKASWYALLVVFLQDNLLCSRWVAERSSRPLCGLAHHFDRGAGSGEWGRRWGRQGKGCSLWSQVCWSPLHQGPEYSCPSSMGGLLAADSLIEFINTRPDKLAPLWPNIIACIAFDTPVRPRYAPLRLARSYAHATVSRP